jgi:hypothetical protein
LSSLTLCFPIGFHFLAYPNLFGIKGFVVVVVVLFPSILVSVDLCFFLCFRDDLEYHCVSVPQEVFIGYDQIMVNSIGLASLELMLCLQTAPAEFMNVWYLQML